MPLSLSLMSLALLLSPAQTRPDPNLTYTTCAASATTTVAMEDCGKAGLASANWRLNAVYSASLMKLPADRRPKLRAAERTWIIFRREDCGVLLGDDSGTMAAPSYLDCMVERTEARIREIERLVQQ